MPRTDRGRQRGPYKTKIYESRGKLGQEPRLVGAFWRSHTMDDLITKTDEEMTVIIDTFLDSFIARQIKNNAFWNFPEIKKY